MQNSALRPKFLFA